MIIEKIWQLHFHFLFSLTNAHHKRARHRVIHQWIAIHFTPMRKLHRSKGFSLRVLTQQLSKTNLVFFLILQRLQNGHMPDNLAHIFAHRFLSLLYKLTAHFTKRIKNAILTIHRHLNHHFIHWLVQARLRCKQRCTTGSNSGRDNLTSTMMRRIGVHFGVDDIESDTAQWFIRQDTAARNLPKSLNNAGLDLVQVIHAFGRIHQHIALAIWRTSKRPNACRVFFVPLWKALSKTASKRFHIRRLQFDFIIFNRGADCVRQRFRRHIDTIEFVG
mmetsp:Transcript_44222/g.73126  ORF Transcript_44222/g.73126 Transcript_44222/m.73126 type:complete len:274 (-) Transcript_44222:901-1722(-)